jgi:hypothetical protein
MEIFKRQQNSFDALSGLSSIVTFVEVKGQINQRIRDNQRIIIDETTSEISICGGKKRFKNGLTPNQKHF